MGKYTAVTGQSIYDIALHIYGSLDGLSDLLIRNPHLSYDTEIKSGDVFEYTDMLFTNKAVLTALKAQGVTPANGTGRVFFEEDPDEHVVNLFCNSKSKTASILLSGQGTIYIGWGDNSEYQRIDLQSKPTSLHHVFDTPVKEDRKVKIFGNAKFAEFNLTGFATTRVYFLKDVAIERYIHGTHPHELEHIRLNTNAHHISLANARVKDLLPLVDCKLLMSLDITSTTINQAAIEQYLIALVRNYGTRRGCKITITTEIRGEYAEPKRDENNKYVITSAMEAVWILTNEPEWQEGGYWHIIINGTDYTTEQ